MGGNKAADLEARFEADVVDDRDPAYADSLGDGDEKIQQRHWIGVDADGDRDRARRHAVPGVTTATEDNRALDLREQSC